MSFLLKTLTTKREVDTAIRDTLDKVLVLRFGRASESVCLQLDDILAKCSREISKFAVIALVDIDAEEVQVYVKYFDIVLIPSTVFFFNAHHMKMDSGYTVLVAIKEPTGVYRSSYKGNLELCRGRQFGELPKSCVC